jgi:calcium-dependent protein kinase
MYSTKEVGAPIKIIDFGLALSADVGVNYDTNIVGTPYYMAPEAIEGIYCKASDVWSLGVVLYLLLTGYLPFGGDCHEDILNKIKSFKGLKLEHSLWETISKDAKDLLKKLMEPISEKRITAFQALQHPWLNQKQSNVPLSIDPSIIDALRDYKNICFAKKKLINVLAIATSSKELDSIIKQFELLDVDKTGFVSFKKITEILKGKMDEKMISYFSEDTLINYTDFLSAVISFKSLITEESLHCAFSQIASSTMDSLSKEDLKAINPMRKRLNSDDVNELMRVYDTNKDGKLDYSEFKMIFTTGVAQFPSSMYPPLG